ncbi:protein FAM200C-like [Clavelina lepadiformis]|uniref:protein FAM200C-like n=1 Tax=Clavelina lepadiformis TaxID=159417 RepID=UPI004042E7DE
MSDDVLEQILSQVKEPPFEQILSQVKEPPFYSIQLDESTDTADCWSASGFCLYSLHLQCSFIRSFFTEYSIPWNKCAGICIDGAAAYTAFKSGVAKRIKDKAPSVE